VSNSHCLQALAGQWRFDFSQEFPEIVHLGLDSEGTGREKTNLLSKPVSLQIEGNQCGLISSGFEVTDTGLRSRLILSGISDTELEWKVDIEGTACKWSFEVVKGRPLLGYLCVSIPLSTELTAPTLVPSDINEHHLLPDWLLIAPDYGHIQIRDTSDYSSWAELVGDRPNRKLNLLIHCAEPLIPGRTWTLDWKVPTASPPSVCSNLEQWPQIRRPWLNLFQLSSRWSAYCGGVGGIENHPPALLANNVLSEAAACSLYYYSDAALFAHELVPGFSLLPWVRHTLDHFLDNSIMAFGNIDSFSKYDLYLFTNPNFINACWSYYRASGDRQWLHRRIEKLHRTADFLLRRDVDGDGLVESINSGNAGSLRWPDQADFYLEFTNFGHKNAYTNALTYRAFRCMSELLKECGYINAAIEYTNKANRLREAYYEVFYNTQTEVLAGWISQDEAIHDHMFTFVNGCACAYGLIPVEKGRAIMQRLLNKLKELDFTGWQWGVPVNLLPIPGSDRIQPAFELGSDGILPLIDDDGQASFRGYDYHNGVLSGVLSTDFIMGLQAVGLDDEADRILKEMLSPVEAGKFHNGIINRHQQGAEFHTWDGKPVGYEGYLADQWYHLIAWFTRTTEGRKRLLEPCIFENLQRDT
jgi:hypothetical protein